MKKLLLFILIAPSFVQAQFYSGNQLKEQCNKATGSYGRGVCHGYVAGINDAGGDILFCTPSNVTLGQITDMVIKYINENPAQLHNSADRIVISAISKDFPCNKR